VARKQRGKTAWNKARGIDYIGFFRLVPGLFQMIKEIGTAQVFDFKRKNAVFLGLFQCSSKNEG
jgi:hypothetical protein